MCQLIYDVTVRFCDRYIDKRSRTHDQMVQAARSGVQNIAEGSRASGTSKKMELKLTNVARASLEELMLDYEDFLRQRRLKEWPQDDPRRQELIDRRCETADDVALWVKGVAQRRVGKKDRPDGQDGRGEGSRESMESMGSMEHIYAQTAANAALVLIGVARSLLKRQLEAQAKSFEEEGGFAERLYARRQKRRRGE